MKRLLVLVCSLLFVLFSACNVQGNYYRNLTATGHENRFDFSGKAHIEKNLDLLFISPKKEITVTLSGTLKKQSGSVQILYITPSNQAIIVADTKDFSKENTQLNTTLHLENGAGRLEFRSQKATLQFDLHLSDFLKSDFSYISIDDPLKETQEAEEEKQDEENEDDESMDSFDASSVVPEEKNRSRNNSCLLSAKRRTAHNKHHTSGGTYAC